MRWDMRGALRAALFFAFDQALAYAGWQPGVRRGLVTKKAAEPLFLLPNKVPANAVRPLILNLKVQGGHLPDASGASV